MFFTLLPHLLNYIQGFLALFHQTASAEWGSYVCKKKQLGRFAPENVGAGARAHLDLQAPNVHFMQ